MRQHSRVSTKLPATSKHHRDMTERLLKATYSLNKTTLEQAVFVVSSVTKKDSPYQGRHLVDLIGPVGNEGNMQTVMTKSVYIVNYGRICSAFWLYGRITSCYCSFKLRFFFAGVTVKPCFHHENMPI